MLDLKNKIRNIYCTISAKLNKTPVQNGTDEYESGFESLTAKIVNDESVKKYFHSLNDAISKNDVRNIAVTGGYGAGKSTVIYSYLTEHYTQKHINVSLAGFDMPDSKVSDPGHYQQIELSILQQILYKVKSDALPDSRIDRILNRNGRHIRRVYWSLLKIIFPLSLAMLLMFPGKAFEILALPSTIPPVINSHYVIKFIAMAVLLLTGLYYIAESASRAGFFDKKLKLNKIAFLSGEVEADTQEKSSLLNNCLDEIVYFFSRLEPYRLVVFEDLDRLKTPDIFVKLRKINKIVNNNLSGNNPLKFIYSVRDDVFSGAESRTKFFDFIIPIIPYMDRKIAFSLLNSKMERYIPAKNSDCLRFTSYFIKDMRCMQNIVNEYKLFIQIVDNTSNPVNLYALVFYKNTYSHDYSLIDKDIGVIHTLIHQFRLRKLHDTYFTQLDEKEKIIRSQIKENFSEKATLHRDLRYEMINRFIPDVSSRFTCFAYMVPNSYNHALQTYAYSQLIDNESTFLDFLDPAKKIVLGSPLDIRGQHEEFSDSLRSSLSDEYQKRKITMAMKRMKPTGSYRLI